MAKVKKMGVPASAGHKPIPVVPCKVQGIDCSDSTECCSGHCISSGGSQKNQSMCVHN